MIVPAFNLSARLAFLDHASGPVSGPPAASPVGPRGMAKPHSVLSFKDVFDGPGYVFVGVEDFYVTTLGPRAWHVKWLCLEPQTTCTVSFQLVAYDIGGFIRYYDRIEVVGSR